jgi:hypothetical protein
MINYVNQLSAAVGALRTQGINSYSWRGRRYRILAASARTLLTEADQRACLLSAVEARLYGEFYCVGGIGTEPQGYLKVSSQGATLHFVQKLSDANHSDDHFDPGWCVLTVSKDSLTIMKDGLRLVVAPTDCSSEGQLLQGVTVSLRTSKECFGISPGYYMVVGSQAETVKRSADTLVRLYWNVTSTGAIHLVDQLTRFLNNQKIAFRLKVLRDPSAYQRCDAAVLYLSKEAALSVWSGLAQSYESLKDCMKRGVPSLTKQLAPGLGLAEDPKQSTSFGQHRCGLIAEGVLDAAQARKRNPEARLEFVRNRFAEEGIDICRPYVNSGSKDDYPSEIVGGKDSRARRRAEPRGGDCLEAALKIGKSLADAAIYSKNSCTWVGCQPSPPGAGGAHPTVFGALGAGL